MRALAALALLLAVPAASGAAFLLLPSGAGDALPCGDGAACVALLPGEASVLVHAGRSYAFTDATGAPLDAGDLCGARLLQVPPGATWLRLTPGTCEA